MSVRALLLVVVCSLFVDVSPSVRVARRDTAAVIRQQYGDFKDECFPRPSGGCNCNLKDASGTVTVQKYDSDADCKLPLEVETALNKHYLNEEIKQKFGDFKENCFPKPSGGCKCNERDEHANEMIAQYNSDAECKVLLPDSVQETAKENKAKVNEEIKAKYGDFKENCFPKPSGGCKCNENDAAGNEIVAQYSSDEQCKVPAKVKRGVSQNVRDPVRERAQANYAAVVNELKDKFRGLKEGCYPRPKGCLCVIGKDVDGRDITERRMKDKDCKCQPGERSRGCPASGA